jgi:hypothetical protein
MIFDQADTTYTNSGTINDGVTIAASGIRLTNTDSGRMYGGVTFATSGSTLINELGGVISLSQFEGTFAVLVSGSDGSDTVINEGLIKGVVDLAAGDDVFINRGGSTQGIELGSGDDTYRVESSQPDFVYAAAGEGHDKLVFAATSGQSWGGNVTGFEDLVFENGGNFENFSGFQSITVGQLSADWDFVNLLNCLNPDADLITSGGGLILSGSSLRSITGVDSADSIQLGFGNTIADGISLGGGGDMLILDSNLQSGAPSITFPLDFGSGVDTLMFHWAAAGSRTYDLSSVHGLEKLNVNAWYIDDPATARVSHISGLTDVDIGQNVTLILSDSISPDARVGGGFGGGVTLEGGVVISRYGFPEDGFWDNRLDIAQGDPAQSTTIVNHGTIDGAVRFYIGDDLYDGRDGSVGGTIYGNAGNDTLLGGAAGETMEGGYGADILEGNGGADTLTGGVGHDTFRGNAAGLNGDAITDFEAADKIVITDANLAGFTFSLAGNTLTYTGGSLTLSGVPSGILVASAAAGGGVQLTLSPFVPAAGHAGDFNGDGRDDILWRNDNGNMSDWLGASNGGFLDNAANAFTNVPISWHMAGTGDFNGDGRDDILWRNDDGRMTDWLGASNGGFFDNAANAYTNVPTSWHVAGVGDFNGDGRDDILWRNDDGRMTDWLGASNGGFFDNAANAFTSVPTSWHVAGVGDFNGDGRDDILWRNDNGNMTDWLGASNGGFFDNAANAYTSVPTSWHIAEVGDFNGDGRDDILWRNDNGNLSDWLGQANGGFFDNAANAFTFVPISWHVEGVGDYNGDGRADILWRNDNGNMSDWLGQSNGGFLDNAANAFTFVPTGWHTQPEIDLV